MLLKLFAGFLVWNALAASPQLTVELISDSGCHYQLAKMTRGTQISIGDLVSIEGDNGAKQDAYFLGKKDGRLLFLSSDKTGQKFTMAVPAETPALSQFEPRPESIKQEDDICSPLTVLSCLKRLNTQNGLPAPLKVRLEKDPDGLLSEMIGTFGLKTLADNDKEVSGIGGRDLQHNKVVDFLERNGVEAVRTSSIGAVIRHLKKGLPALISAHVAPRTEFAPDIEADWDAGVNWRDPGLSQGSRPVPVWAPANGGAHALTGLTVIPRRYFLEGRRLLVLDSFNADVNVWPTFLLRIARPKFILIYPTASTPVFQK